MKKIILYTLATVILSLSLNAQPFLESLVPSSNQSAIYVGSYDWGPCIEKIIINTGKSLSPQIVKAKDFEVKQILYPKSTNIGMIKNNLSLKEVFLSDSEGKKTDTSSNFITLLTDVHPDSENLNPFVRIALSSRFQNYYGYQILNNELGIKISDCKAFINGHAAKFKSGSYSYKIPASEKDKSAPNYQEKTLTLPYVSYLPKSDKKIPLILWFHGIGESGTNPYFLLFGTKSAFFADESIQKYFENGVAILAPQCPTGWLESTESGIGGIRYWEPIDKDGIIDKVKKPVSGLLERFFVMDDTPKNKKVPFAAVSYYTAPVKELLDAFLESHPEIDRKRIYVGGCSAGGYMTMNMMIQFPDIFAAAFPTCEYYLDSKITDEQINSLAQKPMWFSYALNDETVKPEKNSIPTIKRLKAAGAKDIHVSEFRNVVDLSGIYLKNRNASKNDNDYGLPYEYDGHDSWIYLFNDECKDQGLSLFDWLSKKEL